MERALIVSIRLYDSRYHGAGEWPPAPARLFQALVAGVGLSGPLGDDDRRALAWLETLGAPLVAAPRMHEGHTVTLYLPNNDLDSAGGDPHRIAKIRGCVKAVKPRLLEGGVPFRYSWTYEEGEASARHASFICGLAERLYQFGRGIDFACAWGEVMDQASLDDELFAYPGTVHRPTHGENGVELKCPMPGSLVSLENRFRASGRRFRLERGGRVPKTIFTRAPMPKFVRIAYDSPTQHLVFDLREGPDCASFAVWPIAETTRLVGLLRNCAVARLVSAIPSRRAEIESVLVGRKKDGSESIPASERVRIIPLASIGHYHSDRGIRRVLIEVPSGCKLSVDDLQWAFSGVAPVAADSLDVGFLLTIATNESSIGMLAHYGIGEPEGHRRWRTVTPMALSNSVARRRIDPERKAVDRKGGQEREVEGARVAGAVVQALRHAGVTRRGEAIRVQREPFESGGERAEEFAEGTRFSKHSLWHVEIEFSANLSGPLLVGDGRFLGLGLMAPLPETVPYP